MAAPSLTLSNPGVINNDTGTWDKDNALFLKVFSGEVLTSFKRACVFEDLVQSRTIQNGRSAQFPVTGRFTAAYHTPGDMIVGQGNMAQNEVVIKVDDLLILMGKGKSDGVKKEKAVSSNDEASLLNGPSTPAQGGVDQDEIDRLLAEFD